VTDLVWAHVVRDTDRSLFKRCRRAWDLGARSRRNLAPVAAAAPPDLDRAVRDALAVYYFPGMWEWDREIVVPLAVEACTRSLRTQREKATGGPDRAASGVDDDAWAEAAEAGERLLRGYFAWAPTVDDFTPVRVEADFEFDVPDADRPGLDLLARDGRAIRFRGRVDMLVIDATDTYWLLDHRVVDGGWSETDHLVLDERGVTACWGWEQCFLGMRIAGVVYNELRADAVPSPTVGGPSGAAARVPMGRRGHRRMDARAARDPEPRVTQVEVPGFRRTRIPRTRSTLDRMGTQLAVEALEMTDDGLALFPHPTRANCSQCDFRAPCIAMNEGADADALLDAGYRERGPDLVEGRLGGVSWSMNRGAAPPRFGRGG
jgi:hypothetical protein